jgi:DNA modification methylase
MGDQESVSSVGKYRLYRGQVLEGLAKIPDRKIQCCVTSPPYFGLRDYGVDGQIGLEETPDEYVAKLVAVFREVRRVLRNDGTLWLNLGDSYATGTKADRQQSTNPGVGANRPEAQNSVARIGNPPGCKTKDLIGIPWMLAFALRADGWYLRQDIIWHKPNPMPESVKDRCTKAHEYVFLLSKSDRYFFDSEAMKEPAVQAGKPRNDSFKGRQGGADYQAQSGGAGGQAYGYTHRNRRSVWTVATKPYKGAHFATMPIALAEVCVLAGSSVGSIVLDPFGGSGTTAEAAVKHGRNAVLCELNPEYCEMAKKRLEALK